MTLVVEPGKSFGMDQYPDNQVYDSDEVYNSMELRDINSTSDSYLDHDDMGYGDDVEFRGEYTELHSVMSDGGGQFGVSAVEFDQHEELLWMGNQGGHVTSYYGPTLQKYTSFQVHTTNDIKQICTLDDHILSLTKNSLHCHIRRGTPLFKHESSFMENMECVLKTSPSTVLMGGRQEQIIEFDLNTLQELRQVDIGEPDCAILRQHARFICSGAPSGKVSLRDPHSLRVEHTVDTHNDFLSDFDVQGNLLVTAGYSNRLGGMSADQYLMVYDLRILRHGSPINVLISPLLLRFLPAFASRLAVVSENGQFQIVDTATMTQSAMFIYQLRTAGSTCMAFDTSTTCQAMVFGDSMGCLHLFGTNEHPAFNPYPKRTEFSDPIEPIQPIHIDDEITPLSTIPMFYSGHEKLASDWPSELTKVTYRRALTVDSDIIQSINMKKSVTRYLHNTDGRLRNQVPYQLGKKENPFYKADESRVKIPEYYKKTEIKYSKLGSDDFDFNYYNMTCFSGLEGNLPNSYCNSMLQVLYFLDPLRAKLMSHLCEKEFCLSCELGFLFHMLDISKGMPCQANNFLRAFRTIPLASALDLIINNGNDDGKNINLGTLIQKWNTFILQQIHTDTLEPKPNDGEYNTKSDVENTSAASCVFGTRICTHYRCKCGKENQVETTTMVFSLVYPDIRNSAGKGSTQYSFSDVLKRSVCIEQATQAWCEHCGKFQPTTLFRRVTALPDVFSINCGMETNRDVEFWKTQTELLNPKKSTTSAIPSRPSSKQCRYGNSCTKPNCQFSHDLSAIKSGESSNEEATTHWLPHTLYVKLMDDGTLDIQEKLDKQQNQEHECYTMYNLYALVNCIKNPQKPDLQNLASSIKVGAKYSNRSLGGDMEFWHLFNNFVVVPMSQYEVQRFDPEWKSPCVLYYSKADLIDRHPFDAINPITQDVFLKDKSLETKTVQRRITFTPLTIDEMPQPGDIVAMDAEFVSLNQEESELRSDGTRSTIKPQQMAVARVTCVRGNGPLKGVPFIDDYISTQEQVADYLTQFSGIMPGDLDASLSSKHLTTLKSTYLKLRYLVDNGIKFVGHGLKTDFRVINLVVPPEQVIDTVYLFYMKNQRMISLRFLAWHFLSLNIQSVIHDSIEDARTAFELHEKYQELQDKGETKSAIKDLYEKGRKLKWKVPDASD
ncbi:poly(A)-specific ribonuclease [Chamberlinius hualienensis]